MLLKLLGYVLAILRRIASAIFRLIALPIRLMAKVVGRLWSVVVAVAGLFACCAASCCSADARTRIQHFLIIPDHHNTLHPHRRRRNSNDTERQQAYAANFQPRNIHRPRNLMQHLKTLAWRCRRLLCLVSFTTVSVFFIATSAHASVAAAPQPQPRHPNQSQNQNKHQNKNKNKYQPELPPLLQDPNVLVPDWNASRHMPVPVPAFDPTTAASSHAIAPELVSDYANYLVDKLDLNSDASWMVRHVETHFDHDTFYAAADADADDAVVYPSAAQPIDTQSLPSLERVHSKFVAGGSGGGGGFRKVHAPGLAAIKHEARHQELMFLNDFGEEYEPDVKGKKKQELYDSGKLPRPIPPGPPDWFVLRWPPERVAQVAEENERARLFFEGLEREKEEQERREAEEAQEAERQQQERQQQEEAARQEGQEGQEGQQEQQQEGQEEQQQDGQEQEQQEQQEQQQQVQKRDEPPADEQPADEQPAEESTDQSTDESADESTDESSDESTDESADEPQADLRQHLLTTTVPLLTAGKPLRLISSGRGMLQKMQSRISENENDATHATAAVDLSPVLFVISTSYSRLSHNDWALLADWARFMTNGRGQSNGATALVLLHRPRGDEVDVVAERLRDSGIRHHLHEDTGDDYEGIGGGRDDDDPLPPVPDPAAVRYANALIFATAFDRNSSSGSHSVLALVDDDAFVVNAPQLIAALKNHGLVVDGQDQGHATPPRNKDMYLAFPSDPYSDWAFHNSSTFADLYDDELRMFGNATSMAPIPRRFRDVEQVNHVDPSLVFSTAYGGGAVFMAAELATRIANLSCLRRSTPDGFRNDMYRSRRFNLGSDGRPEPGWDEQMFVCARASLPRLQLHVVPSFYSPTDAILYGNDTQSALHDQDNFGRVLGRMHQYNGGTRPIVMHNHRTWHQFDAGAAHHVTDVCGDDCFLQRYEFDDNWVLTNGYSLVHFPDGRGPGTNTIRVPRREIDDISNNNNNKETTTPELAMRAAAYQEQLALYNSAGLVMEQAARPPGQHIDILDLDARHRTYNLLDTSVAPDGTVLQAYVRRRDHGAELFVNGPPGGRKAWDLRAPYMAVPPMIQAGLLEGDAQGDARVQAAEDAPPPHDEIVLLLWRPAGPPLPDKSSSSSSLSSRLGGSSSSWSDTDTDTIAYPEYSPFIWAILFVWACIKLAFVVIVVLRLSTTLNGCLAPAAAQNPAWYTPAGILLFGSRVGSAAIKRTPRALALPAFVAAAVLATLFGSVEESVCVMFIVFVAVHLVVLFFRVVGCVLFSGLIRKILSWAASFSQNSNTTTTTSNTTSNTVSNTASTRSSTTYPLDDMSDEEEDSQTLRFLQPPDDKRKSH